MPLYILATPIGNLQDITKRAIETLKQVDVVLCEDTRVTGKLLHAYEISTPMQSYHQHSDAKKTKQIQAMLEEGKSLALVTDAGTPAISDPGGKLVQDLVAALPELEVIPIPGASAVIAALSISGFPADHFTFLGFPPHKKGRKTYFENLAKEKETMVFYESTHRIMKAMDGMQENIPDRKLMVGRELTKMHEQVYRGTPSEVTEQLKTSSIKGEFVVVIAPIWLK